MILVCFFLLLELRETLPLQSNLQLEILCIIIDTCMFFFIGTKRDITITTFFTHTARLLFLITYNLTTSTLPPPDHLVSGIP